MILNSSNLHETVGGPEKPPNGAHMALHGPTLGPYKGPTIIKNNTDMLGVLGMVFEEEKSI